MGDETEGDAVSEPTREDPDGEGDEGPPDAPVAVAGADDLDALLDRHGTVLVDFYADWCGPCRAMEPVVERLAAESDAAVAKVDVDEHQVLAAEYGVQGVPTFLVFVDGEPVERFVGAQDGAELRAALD